MGTKRRPSPTEEDIDRIAETINNNDHFNHIVDRDTFDDFYNEYFDGDEQMLSNSTMRSKVFTEITNINDDIYKGSIYKDAKGKNLQQDRQRTAKRVTTSQKEYIKVGARKIDLKDYDTRQAQYVGTVKGKIVYAMQVRVQSRGTSRIAYRDKRGRFVSVK